MTNASREQLKPGRSFNIHNVQGGTVIDNECTIFGARKIHSWQLLNNKNQQWLIEKRPNSDLIILKNAQSGRYLAPTGKSNGNHLQCGDKPYAWLLKEGAEENSFGLEQPDASKVMLCNAYGYSKNGNTIWSWQWAPQFHKMMSWSFRVPKGLEGQMVGEDEPVNAAVRTPGKGEAGKEAGTEGGKGEQGAGKSGGDDDNMEGLRKKLAEAEKVAEEAKAQKAKEAEEKEVARKENEELRKKAEDAEIKAADVAKQFEEEKKKKKKKKEAEEAQQQLDDAKKKADELEKANEELRARVEELQKASGKGGHDDTTCPRNNEVDEARKRQRELEAELEESQRQIADAGTTAMATNTGKTQVDADAQRQREKELDEWELALRRRARELSQREERAAIAEQGGAGGGAGSESGAGGVGDVGGGASRALGDGSRAAEAVNAANTRAQQLQDENERLRTQLKNTQIALIQQQQQQQQHHQQQRHQQQPHSTTPPTGPGAEATAQRQATSTLKGHGQEHFHRGGHNPNCSFGGDHQFCFSAHENSEFSFLPRLRGFGRTNGPG